MKTRLIPFELLQHVFFFCVNREVWGLFNVLHATLSSPSLVDDDCALNHQQAFAMLERCLRWRKQFVSTLTRMSQMHRIQWMQGMRTKARPQGGEGGMDVREKMEQGVSEPRRSTSSPNTVLHTITLAFSLCFIVHCSFGSKAALWTMMCWHPTRCSFLAATGTAAPLALCAWRGTTKATPSASLQ